MRHQKKTRKLGRTSQHRDALLANLVVSLIRHKRIKTTLAKAKAARPLAEKLVTLGKRGTLHDHRLAVAKIGQKDMVTKLFKEIAPNFKDRQGGYTRIVKLGPRASDSAPIAFLEWVDFVLEETTAPKADKTAKADKADKAESSIAAKKVKVDEVEPAAKPKKAPKAAKTVEIETEEKK